MYLLQIVSPIFLAISFVWAVVLLRRHRGKGLVIFAIAVGFIGLYELLELQDVSRIGPSAGDWLWMRGIPVSLLALLAVYFIGRSLNEHSRMEEKLRLGDLTYKTLFDTASDIITIVDRRTMTFVDINRAGCERYGYRREELLGQLVTNY